MSAEPKESIGLSNGEALAGKVAFVSGAASGIGRATAQAFAQAGDSVVISDVADEESSRRPG